MITTKKEFLFMSISYNFERFHRAQDSSYSTALAEIRAGRKSSHWMWYIFPQLKGLGYSSMAAYYGIDGLEEAKVYLNDPVLRSRLVEISSALLELPGSDAGALMGYPDNLKLRSSMTLFYLAAAPEDKAVFKSVLYKYFQGEMDQQTVKMVAGGIDP